MPTAGQGLGAARTRTAAGSGTGPRPLRRLPHSGSRSGGPRPGALPTPVPSNAPKRLERSAMVCAGSRLSVAALLRERETGSPLLFLGPCRRARAISVPGPGLEPAPPAGEAWSLSTGRPSVPSKVPGRPDGALGAAEAGTRHLHTGADLARPFRRPRCSGDGPSGFFPAPGSRSRRWAAPGVSGGGGRRGSRRDWGAFARGPACLPPAPRRCLPASISGCQRASLRSYLIPGAPAGGSAGEEAARGGQAGVERGQANSKGRRRAARRADSRRNWDGPRAPRATRPGLESRGRRSVRHLCFPL